MQTRLPFGETQTVKQTGSPPPSEQPADQHARERIGRDLDTTLFVEAGAGTGKTRELIERIVRLVASGRAELRQVAAITFTESAASELQDRLRARLEDAARDTSMPAEMREKCRLAANDIDSAAIETLHAFAQRILTDHPLEAGLPPLIEVQDEIQASIAFEDRWARFIDELLDDDALADVLVRAFTLGLDLTDLRAVASTFHENWDRLEAATFEADARAPDSTAAVLELLSEALGLRSHCTDPQDKLLQHLHAIERYRARLAAQDSGLDRMRVLAERVPLKAGTSGQRQHWGRIGAQPVRDLLLQVHEAREDLITTARASVLPQILEALQHFVLDYAGERRRQGRLEFHDLLVQARNLLRRDPSVRNAVREQFSHLLIDEFQDTDPLQIEIASLIAGPVISGEPPAWHEAAIEEGRLFFVGDPKQSIYAFRRADIVLYQQAQHRYADSMVRLTENFRSVPSVIDWVNHVFGGLIGTAGAEGQPSYVDLKASRRSLVGSGVPVQVLGGPRPGDLSDIRAREAKEIVRIIRQAKTEGWPVNEKDGAVRGARYSDVAVLMPTRRTLPAIEDALEHAGVPYRVESRSLVYQTQEVRDLLSLLRAVDDPTDEVALITSLRAAAMACSDDDLLRYKRAGGRWDYRLPPPDALSEEDPVVAAMAWLHELHLRRWWEPISSVVEAVIRERRLFELAFAHRRPRERWQRLRFVLDQSRAFAEAGGRTLRQFIDWAERQADEGTRIVETVVPEPDDDAVRIMTIHAAKGLEFPIVVLAGLNAERASQPRNDGVLWDESDMTQVAAGLFQTPGYQAAAARHEDLERYEKVRLLYVAATRARDYLVVSLHHREGKDCYARMLAERCTEAPHLARAVEPAETGAEPPAAAAPPFDDSAEQRRDWIDAREQRIESLARAPRRSAVDIAKDGAGDPNLSKDPPVEEVPPWRRGRAGTALGRAVHAVLQSIDLAGTGDIGAAARAQAAAEGIAARADDVERLVRVALGSASVREAVTGDRYWREVYVSASIDGATLEGFIDLLYETPDGLVVVDYKTDALPDDTRLAEALTRYRLQGAAYALALQESLGRPVARCTFVFVQAREETERDIDDLDAAVSDVRERLRAAVSTG